MPWKHLNEVLFVFFLLGKIEDAIKTLENLSDIKYLPAVVYSYIMFFLFGKFYLLNFSF